MTSILDQLTSGNETPAEPAGSGCTRRAFVGSLVAIAGAGVAAGTDASAPNPDGELIGVCHAFDTLERGFQDHGNAIGSGDLCDELASQTQAAQSPLLERACMLRATTIDGVLARVRTLFLYDATVRPERLLASDYANERLLGALLRDLAEWAERGSPMNGRMPDVLASRP